MEIGRKYATGSGADIYIPIVKRDVIDFAVSADWTPAAGDVKVSKDGGAQANIGTLPVYTNGAWKFVFTDAELTCKILAVMIVDSATKTIEDQAILIGTFGHASALHPFDLNTAEQDVNLVNWKGSAPAALFSSFVRSDVRAVNDDASIDNTMSDFFNVIGSGQGLFQAGSSTTSLVLSAGESSVDDFYNGQILLIFDGAAANQVRRITDYDGSTKTATLDTALVTAAPASGDIYIRLRDYRQGAAEIADKLLRMTTATVEGAGGGTPDDRTLYGMIAGHMHKRTRSATEIVLYESDDSTVLVTIPITEDGDLNPVDSIDPP